MKKTIKKNNILYNKNMYFQLSNRDLMVSVAVLFFLMVFYLFSTGSNHAGRHGYPCYCKKCEHQIIDAAAKGEPKAIRKLEEATYVQSESAQYNGMSSFNYLLLVLLMIGGGMYILSLPVRQEGVQGSMQY